MMQTLLIDQKANEAGQGSPVRHSLNSWNSEQYSPAPGTSPQVQHPSAQYGMGKIETMVF